MCASSTHAPLLSIPTTPNQSLARAPPLPSPLASRLTAPSVAPARPSTGVGREVRVGVKVEVVHDASTTRVATVRSQPVVASPIALATARDRVVCARLQSLQRLWFPPCCRGRRRGRRGRSGESSSSSSRSSVSSERRFCGGGGRLACALALRRAGGRAGPGGGERGVGCGGSRGEPVRDDGAVCRGHGGRLRDGARSQRAQWGHGRARKRRRGRFGGLGHGCRSRMGVHVPHRFPRAPPPRRAWRECVLGSRRGGARPSSRRSSLFGTILGGWTRP